MGLFTWRYTGHVVMLICIGWTLPGVTRHGCQVTYENFPYCFTPALYAWCNWYNYSLYIAHILHILFCIELFGLLINQHLNVRSSCRKREGEGKNAKQSVGYLDWSTNVCHFASRQANPALWKIYERRGGQATTPHQAPKARGQHPGGGHQVKGAIHKAPQRRTKSQGLEWKGRLD